MISLEGLTLATGRHREAALDPAHLRAATCATGWSPTCFPTASGEGLYHTADATLWFFHAVDRYLTAHAAIAILLRALSRCSQDIIEHHIAGTRFGIGVDPDDGLLRAGRAGYQLTWMDAKVGRLGGHAAARQGGRDQRALVQRAAADGRLWRAALATRADAYRARAARASHVVQRALLEPDAADYLYDVIDGEDGDDAGDPAESDLRHLAPHPGARSASLGRGAGRGAGAAAHAGRPANALRPAIPDYRRNYDGDLRSRDAAYHQGTVWPWLIGPFVDACVEGARTTEAIRTMSERL